MPRTSVEHASEVRQRIIDGCYRAMLAGGYRGTSIPAIAAEAGVSVGLIYRYFPSKEELYLAVCEVATQAHLDELTSGLAEIDDPSDRLLAAVQRFIGSLTDEDWGPIVRHGWAEVDLNPRLGDLLRRRCDQIRGFSAMFIREAIARGEVARDVDVESLSLAAAMLLDGAIAHHAELGDDFDPDAATKAIIGLLSAPLLASGGAPAAAASDRRPGSHGTSRRSARGSPPAETASRSASARGSLPGPAAGGPDDAASGAR
jgi:AcrR family transcriptional regulator